MRNKHYGVSKGSKTFPFRERVINPDAVTADKAQVEYDLLIKRRVKLIRVAAKWHPPLVLDEVMSLKCQITDINTKIMSLIEHFPEVER